MSLRCQLAPAQRRLRASMGTQRPYGTILVRRSDSAFSLLSLMATRGVGVLASRAREQTVVSTHWHLHVALTSQAASRRSGQIRASPPPGRHATILAHRCCHRWGQIQRRWEAGRLLPSASSLPFQRELSNLFSVSPHLSRRAMQCYFFSVFTLERPSNPLLFNLFRSRH